MKLYNRYLEEIENLKVPAISEKKNKFKESLKITAINTKITPVPKEVEIVRDNEKC